MRRSLPLIVIAGWALIPSAYAQTAASQPAPGRQTVSRPAVTRAAAAAVNASAAAHASRRSPAPGSRAQRATAVAPKGAAAARTGGVLALGATDITGNKELPKVMVIVPWKGSPGAGAIASPMDSLMDEVLGPVDRAAFQRRIRYYGQINAQEKAAPVGDSH